MSGLTLIETVSLLPVLIIDKIWVHRSSPGRFGADYSLRGLCLADKA